MISIRVCAEQFGAGRVRCIGDGVISCSLEIAKEVLDSMLVSNAWVRVESGKTANSIGNVWTSGSGQIHQSTNCS
jgi:hypothetical protein